MKLVKIRSGDAVCYINPAFVESVTTEDGITYVNMVSGMSQMIGSDAETSVALLLAAKLPQAQKLKKEPRNTIKMIIDAIAASRPDGSAGTIMKAAKMRPATFYRLVKIGVESGEIISPVKGFYEIP